MVSSIWKSRERESDTLFDIPSNHCEYSMTPSSMKRDACILASILFDSSSLSFLKSDVVLSVIDSSQSPAFKCFAIRSTQGVTMDAMNSSKLFDALNNRSFGGLNLQA